jgi:hypothetical protein
MRKSIISGLLLTLAVTSASYAVSPEVVDRGWAASVQLTGEGNSELAVERMKDMADLQKTVFNGLQFHEQTQTFVDEMWDNLESFNLSHFYEMLPEQDGEWRQLRVYGARSGQQYRVGPDPKAVGVKSSGVPSAMGDMSAVVRAKKVDGNLGDHYLLRNTVQLGVGEMRWPSVQQAAQETFRVVVDGAPSFKQNGSQKSVQQYRDNVIRMNPHLGSEDVDIIAPLWASFPAMWDLLSHLGSIEDVVYHDLNKPYRQLKVSFVVDPEKMEDYYPHISDHLLSMDRLFQGSFRLEDHRGELLTAELDSKHLRGSFQAFIADGRIVPVKGGKVVLDAPEIEDNKPWNFTAHMNSTMTILGVVTHVNNARAKVQFLSQPNGAKIVGQLSDVPDIRVQGNALGFMPTSMIDVVLPKNLDEIIEEFIAVACKGNEGKGILLGAQFEQAQDGETSNLILKSAFEGLDNFFVRIGMGIVNDRVLPDPKVSDEVRKLIFDTQEAFASDLKGFEAHATSKRIAANNP